MRALWPLLFIALAGCTQEATYSLSGSFTQDRTDADIDEVRGLAAQYGGDVAIMESFPEQFRISGLSEADCDALHGQLVDKVYIGSVGECTAEEGAAGPY